MDLKNKYLKSLLIVAAATIISACSVSYKFNGASIDYTKIKSITIADFPIRSAYVYGPMGPLFNNELKDQFMGHTRLSMVRRNGDLKLEGLRTAQQVGVERGLLSHDRALYDRQCEIHQQCGSQSGLRTAVHSHAKL